MVSAAGGDVRGRAVVRPAALLSVGRAVLPTRPSA